MALSEVLYNNSNLDPVQKIDELSNTEYYIGHSINGNDPSKATWKIKRIWKVSTIWNIGYPSGSQDFSFIFDDRFTYTYK
jgi:hypothetical protein